MFTSRFPTLMIALSIVVVSEVHAPAQRVTFDLPRTVACTVVAEPSGSFKQISALIPISVVLSGTHSFEVAQCEFEVFTLDAPLPVVDYEPQTTLVTDIQGSVSVAEETGKQDGRQLGVGGNFEGVVHGEASLSAAHHDSSSAHFEQLPARDLLAAAGTIRRGTGVFFKLRKTSQTTLEGMQPFTITWEGPTDWRAGSLRVVCRPTLQHGSSLRSHTPQSFLVPLYLTGDPEARAAAEELVAAEHRLLRLARTRSEELQRARRPALVQQLALVEPALPKNWLEQALWRQPEDSPLQFETALPPEIRNAVRDYHARRAAVSRQLEGMPSEGA